MAFCTLSRPLACRLVFLQSVPTHWLQLLGSACLWIAAKSAEAVAPSARDILSMTQDAFTYSELLQMERSVLAAVAQPLQQPTVFDHTSRLLHAISCEERFGLPASLPQDACLSCYWEQCAQQTGPSSSRSSLLDSGDYQAERDSSSFHSLPDLLKAPQPDRAHMRVMHIARMVAEASLLHAPLQQHGSSEVRMGTSVHSHTTGGHETTPEACRRAS